MFLKVFMARQVSQLNIAMWEGEAMKTSKKYLINQQETKIGVRMRKNA